MSLAIRFTCGLVFGFDALPAPGVYVSVYLGIIELAFYNEDKLED